MLLVMAGIETNPGPENGTHKAGIEGKYVGCWFAQIYSHCSPFQPKLLRWLWSWCTMWKPTQAQTVPGWATFKSSFLSSISGWLPWHWEAGLPIWSSPRQRDRSTWAAFFWFNLHFWRPSTLLCLHYNSNQGVHRPGVSWCRWQGVEDCAGASESSGWRHMGGFEQTLCSRETWGTCTK